MQKIKKILRVDPEENASETARQMDRTDFTGFLLQIWRFNHVLEIWE